MLASFGFSFTSLSQLLSAFNVSEANAFSARFGGERFAGVAQLGQTLFREL
jgi:hypothetical protein